VLAPSDCSMLKSFGHKNRSKFFQWFKITSLPLMFSSFTRKININPPVRNPNNGVWRVARKLTLNYRLLPFSLNVKSWRSMWWSRLACFGGKGRFHFVDKSAKVDSAYYVGRLLTSLVDDCTRLLPSKMARQQTQLVRRKLALKQLPRFHCRRPVASNSHDLTRWITM